MIEDKILIDKETLKAMSVDTRLQILKLLNKKKYTQSEIAQILNKSNSSIKEHIDLLINSKLIKKEQTSRKWKYFSLTLKGKRILSPNEFKVIFSFFFSILCAFGLSFYYFFKLDSFLEKEELLTNSVYQATPFMVKSVANEVAPRMGQELVEKSFFSNQMILVIVLLIFFIFLSGFFLGTFFKKKTFYLKK